MTNAKAQMSNECQSFKLKICHLDFVIDLSFGF